MSDDAMPQAVEAVQLAPLRREALLPSERNRGLGTVAVVCTMAGVASGLALATTLMAMQVADTMSTRSPCGYRQVVPVDRSDQGYLGIRYRFDRGIAEIDNVLPGTPAERIGLRPGDRVIAVDGVQITTKGALEERISSARPGARPLMLIHRDGQTETMRPTLISWPAVTY
jgi:S1-C subfamily serine protease